MHLRKIEIQGFKSFPEYTLIEFDKGMTAIVGPNGSGKSNVTDAVRWVLGEQSVRNLRGGKMEDVIFNGTQSRRAMNYAEVSITIDNSDRHLDIDYSEVQVTRRLYRSGESEYQINHVNCRLKDILQLFMDTGLGKDGYSIVGQGRIDDILSTRSEDRRKVLEEASGIVKFKARKEEAERKLLSAEQNLIRISDILGELSEQVGPLKEQSEKAKLYHRTYNEWKEMDIGLTLHLIDRNQAFLATSDEEFARINEEILRQEDEILTLRDKNRVLTEKSSDIEDRLDELRNDKVALSEKIHEVQSSLAVITDRRKQLSDRLNVGMDDDSQARVQLERLDEKLKEQATKIETLRKQKDKYDQALQEKEEEMKALVSTLDLSLNKINSSKIKAEKLSEELFDYKEQSQSLSSELMLFDSRVKSLSDERIILISEKDKYSAMSDESESHLKSVADELSAVRKNYSGKQDELERLRTETDGYREQKEQKQREKDNVSFRIKTLQELESSKEGYQEPVRRLVSDSKTDLALSEKMIGILGDLVHVPREYETAIEIALGPAIHNIVTRTDDDAKDLIDHLKQKKHGRATFLPISTIHGRSLDDGQFKLAESGQGFVGVASKLLTCDDSIRNIVDNLLGRIVVIDTLSNAMIIARASGFSFRLVSLDGDVVNPGGSLTGGSIRRQGTGILGRARDLELLPERVKEIDKEIREIDLLAGECEQKSKHVARESKSLDEKVRELSVLTAKLESEASGRREESKRINGRLEIVDKELGAISTKRLTVQTDHEELLQSIKEHQKELSLLRDLLDQSDAEHKEVQNDLDNLRSDISDMRISAESVGISLAGAIEINEMLDREKRGFSSGLDKIIAEREQAKSEIIKLTEEEEEKSIVRDELLEKDDLIEKSIKQLIIEKDEIEQQLSGFIDRLSHSASKLAQYQTEQAKAEAKRERYLTEIDELKNRMWEEHEITYDNAQSFRLDIDSVQALQKRIGELKNEIREIGPVNANAIEEYAKVSERFDFMSKQKDDIEKARADLQHIINELVEEMRQQFLRHFSIINENFNSVFSDLFNGGTAEIILEDAEDVLSCNIDIRAQPPGKRLQSISLLSGGERCLTAIAILFAILQLRPSPFCVLDEVEAALDDVNISRFTEFVRRYTSKSQFILVTHRKGTMEACDRMYGVTMQERGISKILSMRLDNS